MHKNMPKINGTHPPKSKPPKLFLTTSLTKMVDNYIG